MWLKAHNLEIPRVIFVNQTDFFHSNDYKRRYNAMIEACFLDKQKIHVV